jgi:hypothetical protein
VVKTGSEGDAVDSNEAEMVGSVRVAEGSWVVKEGSTDDSSSGKVLVAEGTTSVVVLVGFASSVK